MLKHSHTGILAPAGEKRLSYQQYTEFMPSYAPSPSGPQCKRELAGKERGMQSKQQRDKANLSGLSDTVLKLISLFTFALML